MSKYKKTILTEENRIRLLEVVAIAIEETNKKIANNSETEGQYTDQLKALINFKKKIETLELAHAINLNEMMKTILSYFWLSYSDFAYLPTTTLKALINYDIIQDKTRYMLHHAELRDAIATLDDNHPMKDSAKAILTDIETALDSDFGSYNKRELSEALNETRKMIVAKPGETKDIAKRTQNYQRYVNRMKRAGTLRYILAGLCVLLAIALILSVAFTGVGAIPAVFLSVSIAAVLLKVVGASALTLGSMSLFAGGGQKLDLANTMSTLTPKVQAESIEMTRR